MLPITMVTFAERSSMLHDTILREHIRHTPVIRSSHLSEKYRCDVFLKLECLQETGAFKLRGALSKAASVISERPDVREFVTASGGNHGLGVASVREPARRSNRALRASR